MIRRDENGRFKKQRKPIQMATSVAMSKKLSFTTTKVLCNDGSMWRRNVLGFLNNSDAIPIDTGWIRISDIPQPGEEERTE